VIGADVPEPGTIRLIRFLPAPPQRVWDHLTNPELRGGWFAGGPMELRPGGRFELRYDHARITAEPTPEEHRHLIERTRTGHITRCDPPRLLAFTFEDPWYESEVVVELAPDPAGTRLTLVHRRLPGPRDLADAGSGWHAHLDVLEARLRGVAPPPFWAHWKALADDYARRFVGTDLREW
jgi:uncharacterized protein YndB with AHSA1/START domain